MTGSTCVRRKVQNVATRRPCQGIKRDTIGKQVERQHCFWLHSDPREDNQPTQISFINGSNFSDLMSDNVFEEYKAKEISRATRATEDYSDESDSRSHTIKWLQEFSQITNPSEADDVRPWPNFNKTRREEGLGSSKTAKHPDAASIVNDGTAHFLQQMSYVGAINYARNRLEEARASKASGNGKRVKLAQTATTGKQGSSPSTSPQSKASARCSAYRAERCMEQPFPVVEAHVKARQAAARPTESNAELSRDMKPLLLISKLSRKKCECQLSNKCRVMKAKWFIWMPWTFE